MKNKNKHSLGNLKPAFKTQQKSPDLTGIMDLQPHDIQMLAAQSGRTRDGKVRANLAGWYNGTGSNKFISVVLSIRFQPLDTEDVPQPVTLDAFFDGDDSEEELCE